MELTMTLVIGVIAIVLVSAFSERIGIATPLALVVAGFVASYLPHPLIEPSPELILSVVLPPLLYSSAVNMPAHDFRRNLRAITGLAVLLVVVSTCICAVVLFYLVPSTTWPIAFALAAVISPTDAVAATSIAKRLGLPPRVVTVLEGEGLINDASALVLLRSAVGAIGATVSIGSIAWQFVASVVMAIIIGAVVAFVTVRVRARISDPVLTTALSFVLPFLAYAPAEHVGASGVLAVVVSGIIAGHEGVRRLPATTRMNEETNWRTLSFLLESGIFFFMGLQLKPLLDGVIASGLDPWLAVGIAGLVIVVLIVVRVAFVVPIIAGMRLQRSRAGHRESRLEAFADRLLGAPHDMSARRVSQVEARLARLRADVRFAKEHPLGWRAGAVLAWSGMRGAITLAAAQTLPADTPERSFIVLIAFVVAVATLLLHGLTLPLLIRAVKIPPGDPAIQEREMRELVGEMSSASETAIDETAAELGLDPDDPVVQQYRADRVARRRRQRKTRLVQAAAERANDDTVTNDEADDRRLAYLALQQAANAAERDVATAALDLGLYSSETLQRVQRMLDFEEARLDQIASRSH